MPEVSIKIGGRAFLVACQSGEEGFLESAAAMLHTEALSLSDTNGRLTEGRMLLMAGLLLADKTGAMEDKLAVAEAEVQSLRQELFAAQNAPAPTPQVVEVPFVPQEFLENLAELSAQAEAVADSLDQKIST